MSARPKHPHKILSAVLACALLFTISGGSVLSRTLEEIQRDINNTSTQRNAAEEEKKSVAQQLVDTESRLHALEQDIGVLQDQLTVVEGELENAELDLLRINAELAAAENRLEEQGSIIDDRLSGIYKQGDTGYLEVILGSATFDDFISRMNYLSMIIKSDKRVMDEFNATREKVEEERDLADAKKQDILSRERSIVAIKSPLDYKRQQIADEKAYKESLYAKLSNDVASKDQVLAALQEEQREASSRAVGGGDRPSAKGFIWPVSGGEITSDYGYRVHPVWGDIRFHYGLDIGVDYVPLRAPAAGTVIAAYWNDAVGNVLEIDHGGGIKTRYCHLQTGSFLVGVGDYVTQGQQVATTGGTGYSSTGPHLHFEVYDFVYSNDEMVEPYYTYNRGYTVSPLGWLP